MAPMAAPAAAPAAEAPRSVAPRPAHTPGVTKDEFALFCWLRLYPDVCMSRRPTDGIRCNGSTTIGSMLVQTLQSQGMAVEWYKQLPGPPSDTAKPNERAAAFIKRVDP